MGRGRKHQLDPKLTPCGKGGETMDYVVKTSVVWDENNKSEQSWVVPEGVFKAIVKMMQPYSLVQKIAKQGGEL